MAMVLMTLIVGAVGDRQSYVIFGQNTGFSSTFDLSTLDGS